MRYLSFVVFFLFAFLSMSRIQAEEVGNPDCVRGEAILAFSTGTPTVASHTFSKVSPYEIKEDVVFESGDKLTIRHWGCEYWMYTLRFEFKKDTDLEGSKAYLKAAELLESLAELNAKLILSPAVAAKTLRKSAPRAEKLNYGELLQLSGSEGEDPPSYVKLLEVHKATRKDPNIIVVELMMGPL